MSLLEALRNRRLRSSAPQGPPKKDLFPEGAADDVDTTTWFEMNFENWYRPLQDCTIRTSFISLSPPEIDLFLARDADFLDLLKGKIDDVISGDFGGSKCFVKLSCRSPKDATVECPQLEIDYRERLGSKGSSSLSDNEKLQLLYDVHLNLLGCSNGEEAVSLLLRSGRIQTDLELAQKESQTMQLLVREWVEIPLQGEFRGFVYKGNLTAVSQYFDTLFFPELADFDIGTIRTFYEEKIKPRISWSSNFVIDFAVVPSDGEEDTILVIELNPFLPTTDACCFNWFRDSGIIGAEGDDADRFFEFRRRTVEMKSMVNVVLTPWKKFFVEEEEEEGGGG